MRVECVTCKGEFGLQIFQCENGHSSCSGCRFMNKVCGSCSKTITDIRNITLEATIADIIVKQSNNTERTKCHNAKDGCSLSFPINEMGNHLKECPFNDIKCPLSSLYQNCTWKGKINQLSIHFNDVHPQHCVADVDKEMSLLNINISQKLTYFVKIGNYNFLIHIKVDGAEKLLYMTAQLFGTKDWRLQ
ncbi:E3 ubiquitin-protein ligase SINA-like 5 isoform X2 [Melitaea cinxia]|uniref:E3 ubiquitin-protein ligase SINA-like 5 isoform X2 n=1 Tax=Melitaea cinxia TaxID=113334 RepID=UPI001E272755|nr:E3 ubiquitin-protein ligase SINA-like 5 isoform X2 [Melitaea cinxia]